MKRFFFQSEKNITQVFDYKLGLSLDETFAYVYWLLNSREYQEKYTNDLKKDLVRILIVTNKEKYVEVYGLTYLLWRSSCL